MDISEFYEKTAVQIQCNSNIGSGCLYQSSSLEYTYVLTAKHCLTGKTGEESPFTIEDIEVTSSNGLSAKVCDYLLHRTLDLAIIFIEYIEDSPRYVSGNPDPSERVILNGYPEICEGERKSLVCRINECPQNRPKFEIVVNDGQLTNYTNSENTLLEGFSGSGVFNLKGDHPILIGIFPATTVVDGAYSSLEVIKIEEFNTLLEESRHPQLVPSYLSSFREYIPLAFEQRSENIAMILSKRAGNLEKITPLMVKDILKDKLMLPYGKLNLNDKNLWIGWITLLTYLYMESGQDDLAAMLVRDNPQVGKHNIKLFYSSTNKRLEDLFKLIINDSKIYQDIKSSDRIVINHEGRPGEILNLSKKKMDRIVTDIGITKIGFMHDIPVIDQYTVTKDISLIHVEYFTDKFRQHVDIEDFTKLEENLKISITEVLNNG
ncbi:ABC-three component system protein [Priestia megaterium]